MQELERHLQTHISSWKMNELTDDSIVLDVLENDREAWVARLNKKLVMANTISYIGETATDNNYSIWQRSIYKIPTVMREVDPVAYEPRVVSLGPYNYGKPQLRAMDELKWWYLQRFINRNPERGLNDYLALVEELESQARGAYTELDSPVDSKDFIQMMLLDCCFVLEILLIYDVNEEEEEEKEKENEEEEENENEEEEEEENEEEEEEEKEEKNEEEEDESIDPIGSAAWALPGVMRDILLLENQLPFFLLERLLELNIPCQTTSLSQIILRMFWKLMPGKIRKTPANMNGVVGVPIHHILHLMYSSIIPTSVSKDNKESPSRIIPTLIPEENKESPSRKIPTPVPEDNKKSPAQKCNPCRSPVARVDPDEPTLLWFPCAKQLREAGVVFKKKENYMTFLEVTFKRGIMEIPPLQIFGFIDSIFRNLIAFEQCHTSSYGPFYISSYAYLMNLVIDTPADVQLLKQEGIIVSTLGSDEDVAIIFNELRKNTTMDNNSHLASVFDGIKTHCHKRTNRWKATLNHNYFSNPWTIISVAAAIFLFVLTIMQTILAFFSYLRPI